jgi:hypothetical protein
MAFSLQGLNNHIASDVTRKYWLERLYSPRVREAHESGDFHIHDLNMLAVYCVGWDLADLLRQGFRGAEGKAESKPARHFRTALGQVANFFYTLQGEAAGAQAFSSVDTLLAPFIARDRLSYEEVKQAVQEWVFNLNVATRVGFQTPFTNITLDLNVPARLRHEAAVIGGELQDAVYGAFQGEMDLFNRAFLDVMIEGDAKGRVFTFPIPTYNIAKDFDYDDPRLEPLWAATARYGIPYFADFVNSEMSPDDARSMCCRLRLDTRALQHRGGGLFGANPLTGSIGVVTLNLPRLGHLATDERDFMRRLVELMDTARDSLALKRKVLERFTEAGLYPYARHYLHGIQERHGAYWHNHFSTIGLVGLEEAARNLLGEGLQASTGRTFGLSVLDAIRARKCSRSCSATASSTTWPWTSRTSPPPTRSGSGCEKVPRVCCTAWMSSSPPGSTTSFAPRWFLPATMRNASAAWPGGLAGAGAGFCSRADPTQGTRLSHSTRPVRRPSRISPRGFKRGTASPVAADRRGDVFAVSAASVLEGAASTVFEGRLITIRGDGLVGDDAHAAAATQSRQEALLFQSRSLSEK